MLRDFSKIHGYVKLASLLFTKCARCYGRDKKLIFTTISPKTNTWNFEIKCSNCGAKY